MLIQDHTEIVVVQWDKTSKLKISWLAKTIWNVFVHRQNVSKELMKNSPGTKNFARCKVNIEKSMSSSSETNLSLVLKIIPLIISPK
jgi:hypothetical protein